MCVFASVKEREGVRACVERERHFTLKGKPGRAEEKEKRNFHFFPNHSEKKIGRRKSHNWVNFFSTSGVHLKKQIFGSALFILSVSDRKILSGCVTLE